MGFILYLLHFLLCGSYTKYLQPICRPLNIECLAFRPFGTLNDPFAITDNPYNSVVQFRKKFNYKCRPNSSPAQELDLSYITCTRNVLLEENIIV